MKTVICIVVFTLSLLSLQAQRPQRHGQQSHHQNHHKHKHVHANAHRHPHGFRPSPYRPVKVVVYRPYWRPSYTCHRRWVYFPHRNFYWDNWRNHYLFFNGTVWISQPVPPAGISSQQLENEPARELHEDEDDVDDVYKSNAQHQKEDNASSSENKNPK